MIKYFHVLGIYSSLEEAYCAKLVIGGEIMAAECQESEKRKCRTNLKLKKKSSSVSKKKENSKKVQQKPGRKKRLI